MHESYPLKRKLLAVIAGVAVLLAMEIILWPVFNWLGDYFTPDNVHDSTNLELVIAFVILYLLIAAFAGGYFFRWLVWEMRFPLDYELLMTGISSVISYFLTDIKEPLIILLIALIGIPGIRLGSHLAYVKKRRLHKKQVVTLNEK